MPITAAISVTQGADKTKVAVADTTPYGGGEPRAGFTARSLSIYKSDGTLYGTYDFSYSTYPSDSIEITGLDKDYAFTFVMTITPGTVVSGSVYVANDTVGLTGYTMRYFYDRMHQVTVQPRYEQNAPFMLDTYKILMFAKAAEQAGIDDDIESAQLALDRARKIELYNPKPY